MILNEYKPMTIGILLDKTFRMSFTNMKNYIKIFILYFFIVIIPSILLRFEFFNMFFQINDVKIAGSINNLLNILELLIVVVFGFISTGVIFDLFIKSFTGEEWIFKKSLKLVIGKFWIIFYNKILALLILILGIISILGWLFFIPCLIFIFPAVLYENIKKAGPISRSFKLIGYSYWSVFGSVIVIFLTSLVLMFLFNRTIFFAANYFSILHNNIFGDEVNIIFNTVSRVMFNILPMIFRFLLDILLTAFYVLIYFNQRIKYEEYGIEKLADSMIEV